MSAQHVEYVLAPELRSARVARDLLRARLAGWGLSAWQDDASVVVSELVTNGVMHARTLLMLGLGHDDQWLEVSVADDSPWPVVQRPPRQDVAADLVMLAQAEQHHGPHLDDRDVRLHVGDAGTLAGGRGLLLVEALADDWGVTPRGDGKVVWARFALKMTLSDPPGDATTWARSTPPRARPTLAQDLPFTLSSLRVRSLRRMETHRIETRLGPVDVRVYRLREGWWPVALGGVCELFAYPVIDGDVLPQTVDAAVQSMREAIDAMAAKDEDRAPLERLPAYD